MAQVKVNITNNDPVTGKKIKAQLTNMPFGFGGFPKIVQYLEVLKEVDDTTDAIPSGNTEREKKAVMQSEQTFVIDKRTIHKTTKVYVAVDDPNAITLEEHFATKVINTLPGVGNADQSWKFVEGVLKEVIAIRQANGELPV